MIRGIAGGYLPASGGYSFEKLLAVRITHTGGYLLPSYTREYLMDSCSFG